MGVVARGSHIMWAALVPAADAYHGAAKPHTRKHETNTVSTRDATGYGNYFRSLRHRLIAQHGVVQESLHRRNTERP